MISKSPHLPALPILVDGWRWWLRKFVGDLVIVSKAAARTAFNSTTMDTLLAPPPPHCLRLLGSLSGRGKWRVVVGDMRFEISIKSLDNIFIGSGKHKNNAPHDDDYDDGEEGGLGRKLGSGDEM